MAASHRNRPSAKYIRESDYRAERDQGAHQGLEFVRRDDSRRWVRVHSPPLPLCRAPTFSLSPIPNPQHTACIAGWGHRLAVAVSRSLCRAGDFGWSGVAFGGKVLGGLPRQPGLGCSRSGAFRPDGEAGADAGVSVKDAAQGDPADPEPVALSPRRARTSSWRISPGRTGFFITTRSSCHVSRVARHVPRVT